VNCRDEIIQIGASDSGNGLHLSDTVGDRCFQVGITGTRERLELHQYLLVAAGDTLFSDLTEVAR
jgi:hypothetical protein